MNPESAQGHGARAPMLQAARGLKANLRDVATRPWRSLARMPKPEVQDPETAAAGHEGSQCQCLADSDPERPHSPCQLSSR
uniref:Ankyrin repeat and death domain containing 1B n=1 Tax=Mus musculus TaxID=10090 RepID=A0A5F8MPW6_MOUSE